MSKIFINFYVFITYIFIDLQSILQFLYCRNLFLDFIRFYDNFILIYNENIKKYDYIAKNMFIFRYSFITDDKFY